MWAISVNILLAKSGDVQCNAQIQTTCAKGVWSTVQVQKTNTQI